MDDEENTWRARQLLEIESLSAIYAEDVPIAIPGPVFFIFFAPPEKDDRRKFSPKKTWVLFLV